jgi:hypothetical protein
MQEVKKFKGLDLLWMVASHETPKQDPSHSIGIDLQSYINNKSHRSHQMLSMLPLLGLGRHHPFPLVYDF